ncbi:MAG: hypothetical protein QOK40_468, partial [Miltoncostaeaceae bacterium]|nr:hypothetical protein [Miltoncostaeaceae bacterium]
PRPPDAGRRPRATALSGPEPTPQSPQRAGGWRAVVYWLLAGAVYVVLGVWQPSWFLLGFQESLIYLVLVTLAAPHVIRRMP